MSLTVPLRRGKERFEMIGKKAAAEKIARYEELKAQAAALEAELKVIEDEFKKELERRGVEELEVGTKKVRWTSFFKNQFDSKGFKAACPDVYAAWTKQVASRRFSVS